MASVCFRGTISFSWMLMSSHKYFPTPSCETFLLKCLILRRQKPIVLLKSNGPKTNPKDHM